MRLELAARQPFSLRSVIHSHGWPQSLPWKGLVYVFWDWDPPAETGGNE